MRALILALFAIASTDLAAATEEERKACAARVQREIDDIDERMRGPYNAAEGERLKARRHRLMDERARCRRL